MYIYKNEKEILITVIALISVTGHKATAGMYNYHLPLESSAGPGSLPGWVTPNLTLKGSGP